MDKQTICKGKEKKCWLKASVADLRPGKLPPASLPRSFSSDLLCLAYTIPAERPDIRVGWATVYLRVGAMEGGKW
jgi:hypothetical protein